MNKEVQERERSVKKKIRNKADYEKVDKLIPKVSKTLFKSRNPSRISRGIKAEKRERSF